MNKLLGVCLCCVILACCMTASAMPPLGLTPTDLTTGGALEIIDGTAYLSGVSGVQVMSSNGDLNVITISHPMFNTTGRVTRVVKATDGHLYVGANFSTNSGFPGGGALYNIDQPSAPIATWQDSSFQGVDRSYRVAGVDRDLTVYGNLSIPVWWGTFFEASRFRLDGSVEPLPYPPGSDSSNNYTSLMSATPSGYVLGDAGIPGTLGIASLVWTHSGEAFFVGGCCLPTSIRDRTDGNGVNVGNDAGLVKYGPDPDIHIRGESGFGLAAWSVLVSQGQFSALYDPFNSNGTKYAFYPGINPLFPNRAVPLLDIFPELAAIDIDVIYDLASVDGYLYMTLSGADGTFLFGARDPSVAVPEPASMVFALFGAAAWIRRRR